MSSNDQVKTTLSRRRGGGRARRARDARIAELGGPARVVDHAIALTRRAWPNLLDHYITPGDGRSFAYFNSLPPGSMTGIAIGQMPFIDALAEFMQIDLQADERPQIPAGDLSAAGLLDLPDTSTAQELGGNYAHPQMIQMAEALAACVPAVAAAILESTVPDQLTAGTITQARLALVDLHRRYRPTDPDYDTGSRSRVQRTLSVDFDQRPDALIELTGRWQYVVRVTAQSHGELRAADGMPIRAFATLHEAKRYAILQSDWSRDILDAHRTRVFMDTLAQIASCGPDGIRVIAPDGSMGGQETIIEPRDTAPVSALPVP